MSGPEPVPLIEMPDWLAGVQAEMSGASGGRLADIEALQGIANAINPRAGTVNCGWNIDAVLARFHGTDPNATSPTNMDGTWAQIQARHNMTFSWNSNFQAAFDAVQNGGPGTSALIGIGYGGGGAHIVAIVNNNGTVGIVEGQDWGNENPREVITDVARANERYNGDGKSNIGWGLVPAPTP
jgi:hypothetical protein